NYSGQIKRNLFSGAAVSRIAESELETYLAIDLSVSERRELPCPHIGEGGLCQQWMTAHDARVLHSARSIHAEMNLDFARGTGLTSNRRVVNRLVLDHLELWKALEQSIRAKCRRKAGSAR